MANLILRPARSRRYFTFSTSSGAFASARHQKKASACRGVVMFGDEASFWLDGTLHVTWSKVGVQPRVDTFGERKTAHVYGALSIERRPHFVYQFADVFNGSTFLAFLKELVRRCPRRKVFLIIDNGPWGRASLRLIRREGSGGEPAGRDILQLVPNHSEDDGEE